MMNRRTLRSTLSAAALLFGTALMSACGSARAPADVAVEPTPAPADTAATEDVREAGPAVTLEPVDEPDPPRPWLPPAVQWDPPVPVEGEAVAIRLLEPRSGRRAIAVRGELDGRPVRFGRREGGWYGLAAAPIDSDGPAELTLYYTVSADSVVVDVLHLEIGSTEFPATSLSVDPRYSSPDPESLERIREERRLVTRILSNATPDWLLDGAFDWPREGRITSPFGQRRVFNDELRSRHTGVDLTGATGSPVRAAARGRVALARDLYYAGKAVYLDHGLGVFTGYFHLSDIGVEEGEIVEKGDLVGAVGATGRVTGPHLHWSLYVNGESLDARSLLALPVPPADPEYADTVPVTEAVETTDAAGSTESGEAGETTGTAEAGEADDAAGGDQG